MVSGVGENPMDVVLYTMLLEESRLKTEIDIKILKSAMETQEALVNELFEAMGIGTSIDIHV
jgi:hypothetical protein